MSAKYAQKPGRDVGDGAFERWCSRNARTECAWGSCRRVIPDGARYCAVHEAAFARGVRAEDVAPRERFERV